VSRGRCGGVGRHLSKTSPAHLQAGQGGSQSRKKGRLPAPWPPRLVQERRHERSRAAEEARHLRSSPPVRVND